MSSTVASTRASVRELHRRGTGMLARSAAPGARSGIGSMDIRGARADGSSFGSDESSRVHMTGNEEKKEDSIASGNHQIPNPLFLRRFMTSAAERGQRPIEPSWGTPSDTTEKGDASGNTISPNVANILAALPLSKIKIVIGERL